MTLEELLAKFIEKIPRKMLFGIFAVVAIGYTAKYLGFDQLTAETSLVVVGAKVSVLILETVVAIHSIERHYRLELKNPTPDNGANPSQP
jgi:hypothetical protein